MMSICNHRPALYSAFLAPILAFVAAPVVLAQGTPGGFDEIAAPEAVEDEGVFISQIGSGNTADVDQQSGDQYARVIQDGADNAATVEQRDAGAHSVNLAQTGDLNSAQVAQEGDGETLLLLAQEGNSNFASIAQRDNSLEGSAAAVLQSGNFNSIVLVQDGSDNQARLTQNGDSNAMTATQLDSGNRLEWTQDGSGLSDLEITQTGGAAMQILQTNTGTTIGGSN